MQTEITKKQAAKQRNSQFRIFIFAVSSISVTGLLNACKHCCFKQKFSLTKMTVAIKPRCISDAKINHPLTK